MNKILNTKADIHLEYSADELEIEVYINGYFMTSTEIDNISAEARREMFVDT